MRHARIQFCLVRILSTPVTLSSLNQNYFQHSGFVIASLSCSSWLWVSLQPSMSNLVRWDWLARKVARMSTEFCLSVNHWWCSFNSISMSEVVLVLTNFSRNSSPSSPEVPVLIMVNCLRDSVAMHIRPASSKRALRFSGVVSLKKTSSSDSQWLALSANLSNYQGSISF